MGRHGGDGEVTNLRLCDHDEGEGLIIEARPSVQEFNLAVARAAIELFGDVGLRVFNAKEVKKLGVKWEGSPAMLGDTGVAAVEIIGLFAGDWRYYMVVSPKGEPGLAIDVRFVLGVKRLMDVDLKKASAEIGLVLGARARDALELIRRGHAHAESAGHPAPGQTVATDHADLGEKEVWNG